MDDRKRSLELQLAGGDIRNIALKATFLAADAGEPVCMAHLLRAAPRVQKAGKAADGDRDTRLR
jgi:hypothetical protein